MEKIGKYMEKIGKYMEKIGKYKSHGPGEIYPKVNTIRYHIHLHRDR